MDSISTSTADAWKQNDESASSISQSATTLSCAGGLENVIVDVELGHQQKMPTTSSSSGCINRSEVRRSKSKVRTYLRKCKDALIGGSSTGNTSGGGSHNHHEDSSITHHEAVSQCATSTSSWYLDETDDCHTAVVIITDLDADDADDDVVDDGNHENNDRPISASGNTGHINGIDDADDDSDNVNLRINSELNRANKTVDHKEYPPTFDNNDTDIAITTAVVDSCCHNTSHEIQLEDEAAADIEEQYEKLETGSDSHDFEVSHSLSFYILLIYLTNINVYTRAGFSSVVLFSLNIYINNRRRILKLLLLLLLQ